LETYYSNIKPASVFTHHTHSISASPIAKLNSITKRYTLLTMADEFMKNEDWKKQMGEFFEKSDMNKDGKVSMEDFALWEANLRKEFTGKGCDGKLDAAVATAKASWEATGMKDGEDPWNRDTYTAKMAVFCAAEKERVSKGEESIFMKSMKAIFDLADLDNDDRLTLEEFTTLAKLGGRTDDEIKKAFDFLDTNKDGYLSREEVDTMHKARWLGMQMS